MCITSIYVFLDLGYLHIVETLLFLNNETTSCLCTNMRLLLGGQYLEAFVRLTNTLGPR